ncbi:tautomerase family protein [Secundilactobacillus folii]|uniref:Tautomerase family protein n=1 Tax=Secundilactobacillus folii TaxID=2678357 RepID=A0A7X2XTM1_9LACO|nr:tautomerase family protein [Secundilactobacillus folii]MTV81320.1 tautomerase family protein [Secundilactobacillus folii]
MPLLQFNLVKDAWTKEQVQTILDSAYDVTLKTLGAPQGDRYQTVSYYDPDDLIMGDTGLGFQRSEKRILLNIRTRPRTREQKINFYHQLMEQLHDKLRLDANDLMITMIVNTDEDWSFTSGKAQFLTGDL